MLKRAVTVLSVLFVAMLLTSGIALADPTPSWGHYTYDEGSSGSWLKPLNCLNARVRFWAVSNPDDGSSFGLQSYNSPGTPYPQLYTYQNNAYFVVTHFTNDFCSGSTDVAYTVRTDPGMGNPSTSGWDGSGISNLSCTLVNDASGKGYNCSFTIAAYAQGSIRTKHYVGFGSNVRSTFARVTLRPADWSAVYHWRNWSYSQVTGP